MTRPIMERMPLEMLEQMLSATKDMTPDADGQLMLDRLNALELGSVEIRADKAHLVGRLEDAIANKLAQKPKGDA